MTPSGARATTSADRDRAVAPRTGAAGPDIADAVGAAILRDGARSLDPAAPEDHLAIIVRAAAAQDITRVLLRQAVTSARASGHSWASIGGVLGLTRQAAQQRFGQEASVEDAPTTRWLGPVTAFDELAELAIAGRQGWHTVEAGLLKHKMIRTDTQWETRRVVWRKPAAAYEKDGWQVGARAFPWLYLVRDVGRPPEAPTS